MGRGGQHQTRSPETCRFSSVGVMTEVHKSRAAEIDLDNIWCYVAADNPNAAGDVSIRAPRAGRKHRFQLQCRSLQRFNPRPACGAKALGWKAKRRKSLAGCFREWKGILHLGCRRCLLIRR